MQNFAIAHHFVMASKIYTAMHRQVDRCIRKESDYSQLRAPGTPVAKP
jgi:hypothetical protein